MSWLTDPKDKFLLENLVNFSSELGENLKFNILEMADIGFRLTLENLPNEIDLSFLSDIVRAFGSIIFNAGVAWGQDGLTIFIDMIDTKNSVTGIPHPVFYPTEAPDIVLNDVLREVGFDVRRAPNDWIYVLGQLHELASIFCSRGSDASVPIMQLMVDQNKPTWAIFNGMDDMDYALMEFICARVNIKTIIAKTENRSILFEIGSEDLINVIPARLS
jgi:hypothetical protein